MRECIHTKADDIPAKHVNNHPRFAYAERVIVPERENGQCRVSEYELPPGMASYPYHYHMEREEVFYILRGEGILRTPEGERRVTAGDYLFFPAGEAGAHKLTNASDTEPLAYIDFDSHHEMDVAVYPDSGNIGVWGKGIGKVYRADSTAGYYDGE